ncbi:hypothetical protein [Mycobacteroides abscessus]|uniref:hypothetical protein n=1 Tax=Mycobacteroides abscessus TaxID=36809 RepID=UPI0012FFF23A|nr:hypothetical protein [Mycobacteroides abscessus]
MEIEPAGSGQPWAMELMHDAACVVDHDVDGVARTFNVTPDIAAVARAFSDWPSWCGSATPEAAWENAVSGDTAARMRRSDEITDWECTAQIIAKAAAYGWWPQETANGEYIAIPIDRWVANGHPFTKIVPTLGSMLDRWNVAPVVIDAINPRAIDGTITRGDAIEPRMPEAEL